MAEQLRVILRRNEVLRRTGLSKSGLYQRVKDKTFASPIRLGPRAVGWLECDVNDWIEQRIRASREAA